MDSLVVLESDLDNLLNPYVTKKELNEIWKLYLKTHQVDDTHKNVQLLSKKICEEHRIDPIVIKALFNPVRIPEEECKEWKLKEFYMPPSVEQLNQFEDSEGIIEDLKKRISYPEGTDISRVGPVNADHDASEWCHLVEEDSLDHENVFHGMITCECHEELPERVEDLKCDLCHNSFKLEELVRFPYVNDKGDGGWSGLYCSYTCLQTHCFKHDTREKILCSLYFEND